MAVQFGANSTSSVTANAVTSITASNLTIGDQVKTALITQLSFSLKTITGVTVTWDNGGSNQAATQIIAANGNGATARSELWGLVAPVAGAKQTRAAWTGSSDVVMNVLYFWGVNQAGGTTTFPNALSVTGNNNAPTITVSSAAGNKTVDVLTTETGIALSAPTQTQTYLDNTPANISAGGSRETASAASVTHAWTSNLTAQWVEVGCDIAAQIRTVGNPGIRPAAFRPGLAR